MKLEKSLCLFVAMVIMAPMHIYGTAAPALHAWTLAVYAGPALAASDSRVLLVRWHMGDRCRDDEAGIRSRLSLETDASSRSAFFLKKIRGRNTIILTSSFTRSSKQTMLSLVNSLLTQNEAAGSASASAGGGGGKT